MTAARPSRGSTDYSEIQERSKFVAANGDCTLAPEGGEARIRSRHGLPAFRKNPAHSFEKSDQRRSHEMMNREMNHGSVE